MRKISEIFVNRVCLEDILEDHKRWLNNNGGERANLMGVDLSDVDLSNVNLRNANLTDTNLRCANLTSIDLSGADLELTVLSGANLTSANLRNSNLNYSDLMGTDLTDADLNYSDLNGADLRSAILIGAKLIGVDLSGAKLNGAILTNADLTEADLTAVTLNGTNLMNVKLNGAILKFADLTGAKLSGADLRGVKYNSKTSFFAMQCPEKGSFIGYKGANNKIVELLITEDSKRSSATTRKCRCSKAKVLSITDLENTTEYNEVNSDHDKNFVYRVGETVEVKDFDDDRWNECSTGIHFFITRDEAVMYQK
jgi:uncharacterized protein YjbI with pentapeptide repeats